MATQSEQIKELAASLSVTDAQLKVQTERADNLLRDVDRHRLRIDELMIKVATLEERCRALEKISDRGWQGWLALIGAGLALIVAFVKK